MSLTVLTSRWEDETWPIGSKQDIYWKVFGPGEVSAVDIKYSPDNGITWKDIATNYPNNGVYSWIVPREFGKKCKIRVSTAAGSFFPCPMGTSSCSFVTVWANIPTIVQTIQVTSPDGRQKWAVGSTQNITWKTTGRIANVKIELGFIFLGNIYKRVTITNSTKNTGVFSWKVPDIRDDDCRIFISDAADGNPIDYSNGEFTIN